MMLLIGITVVLPPLVAVAAGRTTDQESAQATDQTTKSMTHDAARKPTVALIGAGHMGETLGWL